MLHPTNASRFCVGSVLALVASLCSAQMEWSLPVTLDPAANSVTVHGLPVSVATDRAGTWIAAYASSAFGRGTGEFNFDEDIYYVRSMDDGKTWSSPNRLHPWFIPESGYESHPSIATDRNGRWIVVWGRAGEGVFHCISDDDGESWSEPAPILDSEDPEFQLADQTVVATNGSGKWVIAAYVNGDIFYGESIAAFWSEDNGDTWHGPVGVAPGILDIFGYGPRFVDLAGFGGEVFVAVWQRIDTAEERIFVEMSRSADGGATWSEPESVEFEEGLEVFSQGFGPRITGNRFGAGYLNWTSLQPNGIKGFAFHLAILKTSDGGETWSPSSLQTTDFPLIDYLSPVSDIGVDDDGGATMVWLAPNSDVPDTDDVLSMSTADGLVWTDPAPVHDGTDTWDEVPAITFGGNGTWMTAWHSRPNSQSGTNPLVASRSPGFGPPQDINGDGQVNAVDVQLVINAVLGIWDGNGDIDGDGHVNAVDVQLVINAALGIG